MWRQEQARQLRNSAQDRAGYLRALRRELANILMRRDPDRFLIFFRDVYREAETIPHLKPARQNELLNALTSKHKYYKDFDIIGTRDHVLHADGANIYSDEDLENHYRDIVIFQALQHAIDTDWEWFPAVVEKDLSHCEEHVARVKDSRFRRRIEAAIQEWRVFQSAKDDADRYETNIISVDKIPTHPFPEVRYGVHFKDTNEYGVFGFTFMTTLKLRKAILDLIRILRHCVASATLRNESDACANCA